jgi:hypothetical protein
MGGPITSTGAATITLNAAAGPGQNGADVHIYGGTLGGASATGNIIVNADTVSFPYATSIRTTGAVTLAPYTQGGTVGVAGGTGNLQITGTLLGNINPGSLTIGRNDGTGTVTLNSYSTWSKVISFLTGGSGNIAVNGAQTATGSGTLSFTGPTTLSADVTTANQNITFNSAVTLGANSTLSAGNGTITFGGTVNGNYNLTATADNFTLSGAMGGTTALNAVTINSSSGFTLPAITANSITAGASRSTATLTIGNTLTASNATTAVTLTSGKDISANTANSNIVSSSTGAVTLRANNSIIYTNAADITAQGGVVTLNSDRDASGAGAINLGSGTTVASNGGNILMGGGSGAISAGSGYAWGTSSDNNGILLTGATVNAGGGNIVMNGKGYTSGGTFVRGIDVHAASSITTSGSGTIDLNGTGGSTGATSYNEGIYVTGGSSITGANGAVNITGTGGFGTVGNNYGIAIDTASRIYNAGSGALTLTTLDGTNSANAGLYANSANNTLGDASDTGAITLNTNGLGGVDNTFAIRTSGNVTIAPNSAGVSVGTGGGTGTLALGATALNGITAGSLTIGRNDSTQLLTAAGYSWNNNTTLLSGSGGITFTGVQAMGAHTLLAKTASTGDVTIANGGGATSTAANDAIILASAHNFANSSGGATPLSVTGGGRWLVYSTNPASDTLNSMTGAFRRFSCTYGGSCPTLGAGNGLLYTLTPTLTATPAAIALTYGDAVPTLTGYGYTLTGYLGSDSGADSVTGTLTGATTYTQGSNAGSYNVDYSSGTLASAMGYAIGTYANNATAITVGKKTLAPTVGNKTIVYGDAAPTLDKAADVNWNGGFYGSDNTESLTGVTFTDTYTQGNHAGSYVLGISGITSTNYQLGTVTNGALTVGKKTLTPTVGNKTIVYGDTAPTLDKAADVNWNSGFYGSDNTSALTGVTFTDTYTQGSNAGSYVLGISGITSTNYQLGSVTNGALTVGKKTLTPTVLAKTITYGDAAPTLDKATDVNWNSGFYGSDNTSALTGVTFTDTYSQGNNIGSYVLGISGITATNYQLGSVTNGALTVGRKTLTASLTGAVSRGYDGTNAATLTAANYSLAGGVLAGDSVSVSTTSGTYDDKNAGTGKTVTVNGLTLAGTGAGNYQLSSNSASGAVGDISKAALTITADSATRAQGAANPAFTASYNTFKPGDNASAVTGLTLTTAADANSVPGTYAIVAAGASALNYVLTFVNGLLTVTAGGAPPPPPPPVLPATVQQTIAAVTATTSTGGASASQQPTVNTAAEPSGTLFTPQILSPSIVLPAPDPVKNADIFFYDEAWKHAMPQNVAPMAGGPTNLEWRQREDEKNKSKP